VPNWFHWQGAANVEDYSFGPAVQVLPSSFWRRWESDRHKGVVVKPKLLPQLLRGAADDYPRTECGDEFRRSARFYRVVREPRLTRAADLVTRFYATSNRVLTVADALIDFIGDQVMAI
jgi:hypothetical protein